MLIKTAQDIDLQRVVCLDADRSSPLPPHRALQPVNRRVGNSHFLDFLGLKDIYGKKNYKISFTRHLYKQQPLRTLEKVRADILAVEKEAEGLLDELLKGDSR